METIILALDAVLIILFAVWGIARLFLAFENHKEQKMFNAARAELLRRQGF